MNRSVVPARHPVDNAYQARILTPVLPGKARPLYSIWIGASGADSPCSVAPPTSPRLR